MRRPNCSNHATARCPAVLVLAGVTGVGGLAGCQGAPDWKLDILADGVRFRTTEAYPRSLWTFYRATRTYEGLRKLLDAQVTLEKPIILDHVPEAAGEDGIEVFAPESTRPDAGSAEAAGTGDSRLEPTAAERVLFADELGRFLLRLELPTAAARPWIEEGTALYLGYGTVEARQRKYVLPDFAEFARLTETASASPALEPGEIFTRSTRSFGERLSLEARHRAALVVGYQLSRPDNPGFRASIETLARMAEPELLDLEAEALRSAYGDGRAEAPPSPGRRRTR